MILNYFKIAWRNLRRNKLTSFINIFGLTISISICLLIALFIYDELNYDKFEKDHERIYRLEQVFSVDGKTKHWAATPAPLKGFLTSKFPEIESAARLFPSPYAFIKLNDNKLKEEHYFLADSSIFETLGLTLLQGNPNTALASANNVVLTAKIASKLFGAKEAMNQTLVINSRFFTVTGILKDLPSNSHLKINMLSSLKDLELKQKGMFEWSGNAYYTYVKVAPNTSVKLLMSKADKALYDDGIFHKPAICSHYFHNISKIHLDGNVEKELFQNNDWIFIYIFITIGVLIILLASINYINLTTTRSLERSKEIGIRKTLGAFRKTLILQFVSESVFTTLLSFVIALLVVLFALPQFNAITNKSLELSSVSKPAFILMAVTVICFIGLLAGIYPAFVISSFSPVKALKGISNVTGGKKFSLGFRKSLVVFQFAVSVILVVSSIAVINQISYMFDKPLGYNKENLIVLPCFALTKEKLNVFRNELKSNPHITDVSGCSATPGKRVYLKGLVLPGGRTETMRTMCVDEDYMKTMKMEIVRGRHFNRNIASDSTHGLIFNEAAVEYLGLKDSAFDQQFVIFGAPDEPKTCRVIGVVKNFHQGSLHNAIEPMVFHVKTLYNSIIVRYSGETDGAKQHIASVWNRLFPDQLFTYNMLVDDLEGLYRSETTLKKLLIVFTAFAIAIAMLGLFGLIFFTNTLRKKEIGIRKILGAENGSIIYLLSRDYVLLTTLALLIALPISNYFLNKWLNNFAYHTSISVFTFVGGSVIILLIAFATVFMQGLKAALANPVENIKTE
jgi:putative ABC transport system permease protein